MVWGVAALFAAPGCPDGIGTMPRPDGATLVEDMDTLDNVGLALRRTRTTHYSVMAVGPKPSAERELPRVVDEVGRWMERALAHYERVVGVTAAADEPLPVTAHLVRKAYDYEAARLGFPPDLTSGFCTIEGAVHVYYRPSGTLDPAATLMHEGFHQYCYRVFAYPTPAEVFQTYPGYARPKLTTIPLWLAEGAATVFESAALGVDLRRPDAAFGRLDGFNKPRLDQLKRVLRRADAPRLRDVLLLQLGDSLNGDTYAVMWGICYDLFRGGNRDEQPMGRMLRDSGMLWGLDPAALFADCLREAKDGRTFERAWNRRMTEAALARFTSILAANGHSLETWERGWKERMLQVR